MSSSLYSNPYAAAKKYGSGSKNKYLGPDWQNPYSGMALPGRGGSDGPNLAGNPYADLINNLMNQGRNDIRAEGVSDAASRDAAIRRLLISYGETPDLGSLGISGEASGVLGSVMDEKTRGLAAQNTAEGTSVKARLDAANKEAQAAIPRQLAGRGMFRSGETGAGLAKQAMSDKQSRFDTLNEMLGNVESAVGGYAANERQRQRQLADLEMQAAQRQWEIWNATKMAGGDAGEEPMQYHGSDTPGVPYGGSDDPYYQELVNWYSANANRPGGKPARKVQALGPYGPYGPAIYTEANRPTYRP